MVRYFEAKTAELRHEDLPSRWPAESDPASPMASCEASGEKIIAGLPILEEETLSPVQAEDLERVNVKTRPGIDHSLGPQQSACNVLLL